MGKIRYTTFSEAGVRRNNEDFCQLVSLPEEDRYLFVVCDGMGGHAMGEVASRVVCETICNYWQKASTNGDVKTVLRNAFKEASKALDAKADVLNHVEMGTTMVLAAIESNHLTIAHAGDSRCYFLRPDVGIVYQTQDHVNHSVWGNVEIYQYELKQGDRCFLCTDGVCQYVEPSILTDRLMDDKSPEDVIDVIKFLCEKFSKDNYTGILVYND